MTFQSNKQLNDHIKTIAKEYNLKVDSTGDGSLNATLAIIGEYPGEREVAMGMPLCGGAGQLLWDNIRQYGLNRRNVYSTNIIKRRLLGSGKFKEKIKSGEVDLYKHVLMEELEALPNLKYILCLGSHALTALTGKKNIYNYRGSVLEEVIQFNDWGKPVTIVCAISPSAILREPRQKLMFKFDMYKLNQVLENKFVVPTIKAHINPSFSDAMDWIDKMQKDQLPTAYDVETSSKSVICHGLGNSTTEAMCINLRNQKDNRYTVEQEYKLLKRLEQFLCDDTTRLVMQNGMYDASYDWFIERLRIKGFYFDTMLAHHALYPTLPHNLGFITSQYTNHPYYKDDGKLWKETGDIDEEWLYNCKDVCITLESHFPMLKELEAANMTDFFFNHVMKIQPELVEMATLGIKVDLVRKSQLSEQLTTLLEEKREKYFNLVQELTDDKEYRPNPNSPAQLSELLFTRLRLVGRGVSTDAKNREYIKAHPKTTPKAKELITILDEIAKERKFLSTYVNMVLDDDGKIRTEYKQIGVVEAPGRLSSASTGWGTGTNLQNQPDRAQQMFVCEPDCEFSYFDLSQAEARVVGWVAPIPKWIQDFERARLEGGFDCHRSLAVDMFGVPYDEVPKYDIDPATGLHTIRFVAKRCRHGLNYRMMAARLAETLGISFAEADNLWRIYHQTNPEIQTWWEDTIGRVKKTKQLINPFGRRWILLEDLTDDALESIIAFYPQSTIGDKVNQVIYQCHNDPEWPKKEARIVLNIHDALIALNKQTVGPEVRAIMKKYAESPLIIKGFDNQERELIIPADLKVSQPDELGIHRWSTLKGI